MHREFQIKDRYQMEDLLALMEQLRGENGCPWDKEQTHQSIRKNLIEETYEVIEAIDKEDSALLREELGDLLLQIVFHTRMEEETDSFTFDDVVTELCEKLVVRHPHVFGEVVANDSGTVLKNWDAIKRETKEQKTVLSTLTSVPSVFPALMRAQKVQQRASRAGMDFPSIEEALASLQSELEELKSAMKNNLSSDEIADEMGDLLFSCCNLARFLTLDNEECLTRSTEKFIGRMAIVEALATKEGQKMEEMTPQELDELWKIAKKSQ